MYCNRLQWVDLQLGNAAPVRTMSMSYDAGGRILSKEGISYGYDTASPVHAVKSRAGQSYFYDLNGNQTQRDGSGEHRTLTYTHFDKPARVWVGDHREESRYTYIPQRGRLERESWRSGVLQERYWFLGSLDVVVTNPSATNPSEIRYEYRRQIDGIAQVQIENGSETLKYFHYDHLGSVTAMSDTSPNLNNTQFSDYDAFGRRRHAQLWHLPITTNILNNATEYGFGGHESRDELGLVHMNGRSYDPDVGQMMQADAVVQSPMDGQNYNRYAYVFNNPLSYTDPTGYEAEGNPFALPRSTVYGSADRFNVSAYIGLFPTNTFGLLGQILGFANSVISGVSASSVFSTASGVSEAFSSTSSTSTPGSASSGVGKSAYVWKARPHGITPGVVVIELVDANGNKVTGSGEIQVFEAEFIRAHPGYGAAVVSDILSSINIVESQINVASRINEIFRNLISYGKLIQISPTDGGRSQGGLTDKGNGFIRFNFREGLTNLRGGVQSPLLGFVHEAAHVLHGFKNPKAFEAGTMRLTKETNGGGRTTPTENFAIAYYERPLAQARQEGRRGYHNEGKEVSVSCLTCKN